MLVVSIEVAALNTTTRAPCAHLAMIARTSSIGQHLQAIGEQSGVRFILPYTVL